MANEEKAEQLLSRLDVMINLMLEKDPSVTLTNKVLRLSEFGLAAPEIAKILRKPGNQVRDVFAKQRKRSAK